MTSISDILWYDSMLQQTLDRLSGQRRRWLLLHTVAPKTYVLQRPVLCDLQCVFSHHADAC